MEEIVWRCSACFGTVKQASAASARPFPEQCPHCKTFDPIWRSTYVVPAWVGVVPPYEGDDVEEMDAP